MKTFLAVFTGTPEAMDAWKALDADTRAKKEQAGIAAWQAWMAEHADALVDPGAPLGKTKRIDGNGITDTRNNLGAYVVVRAEDPTAAARLFANHPHFTIFPGDGVEVMERLPIPG